VNSYGWHPKRLGNKQSLKFLDLAQKFMQRVSRDNERNAIVANRPKGESEEEGLKKEGKCPGKEVSAAKERMDIPNIVPFLQLDGIILLIADNSAIQNKNDLI
jgi:hypothetical protein